MPHDISNELNILNTINYIDSALFGLSVDVFKLRLLISLPQSPELEEFGINEYSDICCNFLLVSNIKIHFQRGRLGPGYLKNRELSAINIADFDFEEIEIKNAGKTNDTDMNGEYGELRDIYEVKLAFSADKGEITFQFADIKISTFDLLELDPNR